MAKIWPNLSVLSPDVSSSSSSSSSSSLLLLPIPPLSSSSPPLLLSILLLLLSLPPAAAAHHLRVMPHPHFALPAYSFFAQPPRLPRLAFLLRCRVLYACVPPVLRIRITYLFSCHTTVDGRRWSVAGRPFPGGRGHPPRRCVVAISSRLHSLDVAVTSRMLTRTYLSLAHSAFISTADGALPTTLTPPPPPSYRYLRD